MDRKGEINLILRLNFLRLTRMKVPALESRLTGLRNVAPLCRLAARENRKISGSLPGKPLPAIFPSPSGYT